MEEGLKPGFPDVKDASFLLPQQREILSRNNYAFFPQADSAVHAYLQYLNHLENQNGESTSEDEKVNQADILRGIFDEFLTEELRNTRIYERDDKEAALPYTHINITDFATKLYERLGGQIPEGLTLGGDKPKRKTIVVFPSTVFTESGSPFTYVDVAMQQLIRGIHSTIRSIHSGRKPDQLSIVTLGAVTNKDWGYLSKNYADRIKNDAFDTAGETYAELLTESNLLNDMDGNDSMIFWGTSMGVSFAAATANKLLGSRDVVQSTEERRELNKPYLQVRGDAPAGVIRPGEKGSIRKGLQVATGFVRSGLTLGKDQPHTNYIMKNEKPFLEAMGQKLRELGIDARKDPQTTAKTRAIINTVWQLLKGVPYGDKLKLYMVKGYKDLTTADPDEDKQLQEKMEALLSRTVEEGVLDEVTSTESPRVYGANMIHSIPFFHKDSNSEMRRWRRTIDLLSNINEIQGNTETD